MIRGVLIFFGFSLGVFLTYHVMDNYKYTVVMANVMGERSANLSTLTTILEENDPNRSCIIAKEIKSVARQLSEMELKADMLTAMLYSAEMPALGFKESALSKYAEANLPECSENA